MLASLLCSLSTALVTVFPAPGSRFIVDLAAPIPQGWEPAGSDAPWSLDLSAAQGLVFETVEYKAALPGFVLETDGIHDKGTVRYKMTAYFCKRDKSACQRQVFEGSASIP